MTNVEHEIINLAKSLALKHDALAHELRVLILTIIAAQGRVSWADLKSALERIVGSINPNTLAFHIKKLISRGYVEREGGPESVIYKVNMDRVTQEELRQLIDKVKPYLKGG